MLALGSLTPAGLYQRFDPASAGLNDPFLLAAVRGLRAKQQRTLPCRQPVISLQ